jgi:hypothetical protein
LQPEQKSVIYIVKKLFRVAIPVRKKLYRSVQTSKRSVTLMHIMKRIPFFILSLSLVWCASAAAAKKPQQLPADTADVSNVQRALEQVLDRGDAVKVTVDCMTAFEGLSAGYRPEDYGCEDDNDATVETEKFFLRDSLGKYARFSVSDGSEAAVPPAASPADDGSVSGSAADASAADVPPAASPAADVNTVDTSSATPTAADAADSGNGTDLFADTTGGLVTHRIVIEVRNRFSRESGMTICRYIEKRQLLDARDGSVIAEDNYKDSRVAEYRPSSRGEVTIGDGRSTSFSFEKGNSPYVSRMKERETGGQKYYTVEAEVEGVSTAASRTPETTASTRSLAIPKARSRSAAPSLIPGRQLVRVLRQRAQNLHARSDQELLDRFFELCPEDRDRIVVPATAQ